jgi:hypothetical protein
MEDPRVFVREMVATDLARASGRSVTIHETRMLVISSIEV